MRVAPSILACDYSCIGDELRKVERANADLVHLDVMDGHFVPNISFGSDVIADSRKCTNLPFDVHLMIDYPDKYIDRYVKAGADIITIHEEAKSDVRETIENIKSYNVHAGLSVKPNTPIENVFPYLDDLFLVLIMTVEPGFGGQSFMQDMMPKVTSLKREICSRGLNTLIEVDGGINRDTVKIATEYGVDISVAGTYLFKAHSMEEEIGFIHSL